MPSSTLDGVEDVVTSERAGRRPARAGATLTTLLLRPATTAVVGAILAFVFFVFTAGGNGFLTWKGTVSYLEVAALIGILGAPVTLLLIAGEFDLSIGAAIGATGIFVSYLVVELSWPLALAVIAGLAFAVAIGLVNGALVALTRIPSFLVTLAVMYLLQGLTLSIITSLTGQTSITGVSRAASGDPLLSLFRGDLLGLPVSVWWWFAVSAACVLLLSRTKFGNWIFVAGGNADAGARMGVPVHRVRTLLYVATACSTLLVALLSAANVDQADATRGTGMEFQAAVAVVIGGTLITGGYGSPIGTMFGALVFGMVSQGFFFTSIDGNYFLAFLGAMLLIAVGINQYVRGRSMKSGLGG